MLNLDTHIVIHAFRGSLSRSERKILESDSWGISTIVLWEIFKLVQLGRIEMDFEDPELLRALNSFHAWPITYDVCRSIGDLDFRADPADEIIAATSLLHGAPLVTRDRRLRASKVVPVAT